jgi:hypothetical protein
MLNAVTLCFIMQNVVMLNVMGPSKEIGSCYLNSQGCLKASNALKIGMFTVDLNLVGPRICPIKDDLLKMKKTRGSRKNVLLTLNNPSY